MCRPSPRNPDWRSESVIEFVILGKAQVSFATESSPLLLWEISGMSPTSILASIPHETQAVINALLATGAFGLLGLSLMLVGFKGFEVVTDRKSVV